MAAAYAKQIEQLQSQIEELQAKKEKEEREREVLEKVYEDLKNALHADDISIDSFLRFAYRDVKRVVARIEKERAKEERTEAKPPPVKKATTKKKGKRGKAKKQMPVKIPAGQYKNIPPTLDAVHTVNEKGPRPKVIKAYVEEIGIDRFLEECRIDG